MKDSLKEMSLEEIYSYENMGNLLHRKVYLFIMIYAVK